MDKMISIIQFAMSILVFVGIAAWGICHICMGNLKGFGLLVICFLLFLAWQLIQKSWSEYQQEKNK